MYEPSVLAVVLLEDRDPVFEARGSGALAREPGLGARKGEARHACAVLAGGDERERAPAAADLEDAVARPQREPVAHAAQLPELGLLERLVGPLEDRARVRQARIEHQAEEVVPEVVVRGDVAPRREEALPAVGPWTRLEESRQVRMPLAPPGGVQEEQLEEADEVVGMPLACRVSLTEPDAAPGSDPREGALVTDLHPDGSARSERACRAVGQAQLERTILEPAERTLDDRPREPREGGRRRRGPRESVARRAHRRTEPAPGTKGGL